MIYDFNHGSSKSKFYLVRTRSAGAAECLRLFIYNLINSITLSIKIIIELSAGCVSL